MFSSYMKEQAQKFLSRWELRWMKLIGKTYLDGKKTDKQSCCGPAMSASGTGLQMFTASLPGSAAVCVRRWASGRWRGKASWWALGFWGKLPSEGIQVFFFWRPLNCAKTGLFKNKPIPRIAKDMLIAFNTFIQVLRIYLKEII